MLCKYDIYKCELCVVFQQFPVSCGYVGRVIENEHGGVVKDTFPLKHVSAIAYLKYPHFFNGFRQQRYLALGSCCFYAHTKKFGDFRNNKFKFTANTAIMSSETGSTVSRVPQQCIYL